MKFSRNTLIYLAFTFLLLFLIFGNIWQQTRMKEMGYEAGRLKERGDDLENENMKLKLKIDSLKSPKRIEEIATNELGMVVIQPEDIIVLKEVGEFNVKLAFQN